MNQKYGFASPLKFVLYKVPEEVHDQFDSIQRDMETAYKLNIFRRYFIYIKS